MYNEHSYNETELPEEFREERLSLSALELQLKDANRYIGELEQELEDKREQIRYVSSLLSDTEKELEEAREDMLEVDKVLSDTSMTLYEMSKELERRRR